MVNGATHWGSIWDDIQELRLAITNENGPQIPMTSEDIHSPVGIIFGGSAPMTLDHILARYLPSRQELDRHVSTYFKAQVIAAAFVHLGQFQRLYQKFLEDPLKVSPLWVSMLFSICDIARDSVGSGRMPGARNQSFAQAAAHCLVLGEYFKPQQWAPEAILVFVQARCLSSAVLSPDVAPIFALASRVATAMGYHRRPESLGVSPFAAEMRRRVWSSLTQLDLLTSFHLGLPKSTPGPMEMVDPPRNLNDSDFDEDDLELPTSRPLENPTGIQFAIAKQLFMGVFDKILRAALESQQNLVSFDRVQALHEEVETVFASMPDTLKPRKMTNSVFDSATLIVTRLCVMFIYTKSLCVLHRPYVLLRRPESIQACYDASTMLTDGLCDAYHEFRPGGQANSEPWFMSSLTWHDFLLGTVALCLSALVGRNSISAEIINVDATCHLLSRVSTICAEQSDTRGSGTKRVRQIAEATADRLRGGRLDENSSRDIDSIDSGFADTPGEGWVGSIPEPMEDSLWDEYMGQYLNLDMLLSS